MTSDATGILLVTSGLQSPEASPAAQAFERLIHKHFPAHTVRWACTSRAKRNRVDPTTGQDPAIRAAIRHFTDEGIHKLAVQALHLIPGIEHEHVVQHIQMCTKDSFPGPVSIGEPLLAHDNNIPELAAALVASRPPRLPVQEAVLWVGHGSPHAEHSRYHSLASHLQNAQPRVFIGALRGDMGIASILEKLTLAMVDTISVAPLLALPGHHAVHDILGDSPSSWLSQLQAASITCHPLPHSMVEYPAIAELWLARLQEALAQLRAISL